MWLANLGLGNHGSRGFFREIGPVGPGEDVLALATAVPEVQLLLMSQEESSILLALREGEVDCPEHFRRWSTTLRPPR